MGRHAEGWKIEPDPRTGIYFVRFRHAKRRYNLSTGTRDPGEAAKAAAAIYAAVIAGTWAGDRVAATARAAAPLDELGAHWLAAVSVEVEPKTLALYEVHLKAHLVPFFGTLDRIVGPRIADYRRARLAKVVRATVVKELSTLARFLRWCFGERKCIAAMPVIEYPPKAALGTPDTRMRHKRASVPIDESEAHAVIDALPELATRARRGKVRHAVRDFFIVLWETGLRPETVSRLRTGVHFTRGGVELEITRDIDKVRYARPLPLTEQAIEALDRWAHWPGELIFGDHDYRTPFRKACRAALAAAKRETATPYDFRHGRTTQLGETPGVSLAGMARLAGHKNLATTSKYVHAQHKAAKAALDAVSGRIRAAAPAVHRVSVTKESKNIGCEGGESNPYGNNPASTSKQPDRG